MFAYSTRRNLILSTLFIVTMGACGNLGGCGACSSAQPLPGGKLPADQTVEGGAQIRVTPAGFDKLKSILPGILNSQLSNGFCVPQGQVGSLGTLGTGAKYCSTNAGGGCSPGCRVNVALNSLTPTVTNAQNLNMQISTSISTTVHIDGKVVGIGFSCDLGVSSNNLNGDVDIAFGIKPADGELDIHLAQINSFHLGLDFSGCGPVSSVANLASTILDSFLGQFLAQLLTPALDNLVQGLLPNPLGVKGLMDVGALLEGISPGTEALMESRIVPGGYVSLTGNGMSLGVITGMNADEDPATRTGIRPDGTPYASEPNLCVPPLPAPSFGSPPASLPLTSRATFGLRPANEFSGAPDPSADVAMGVSETFLDLAGHHLVTSGAMCLGVGTSYIHQLNVGTIGILVPSLAELQSDKGNDPLLLVTRPQKAVDFTIGENTVASPALTIGITHMEVDFYAFLYERYVRAFTLDLTMNIGVNLDFEQPAGMPAVIKPMLVGISAASVTLKVLNSEFVRETPQHLEQVLPSVFDLVTPLLGNLPAIQVPSFAGLSLSNLAIKHVTTTQDDFLALYATLGSSFAMRNLAMTDKFAAAAVAAMDSQLSAAPAPSVGRAHLRTVNTPEPAKIRASLTHRQYGEMPTVTFDVDRFDERGRELEWSYNLNGGLWRPYTTAVTGGLVIRDPAFAWQGKYEIGLKSRIKGDYRTTSDETRTKVIIDSVGPRIIDDQLDWDGDVLSVPMFDIVSEHQLVYAFGKPGSDAPSSEWFKGSIAKLERGKIDQYLDANQELLLFSKDEVGNTTIALIAPFHGQPGGAGCACEASGGPSTGGIVLVILVAGVLVGRGARRRYAGFFRSATGRAATTIVIWLGASVAMSLQPGCSCGNPADKSCELASDCGPDFCAKGELPYCIDNTCVCSDDIPAGRVGPYSDVAVGKDGSIWVSAYAQTHGDLVVAQVQPGRVPDDAWEWVDGVPDGPVVVPDSKIRGGIDADGPDVGMYTSIAVGPDNQPMVTYFDRDTGSLKFAAKVAGTWQIHTIQAGTGTLGESGALIGMYSSLSLRTDDGRPGVAYLAHVMDTTGGRAEVRYASAQTANPTGPGDWQTWVVDTAPLPAIDPQNPNVYPLPEGLGLFVDSARLPNQAPVVVYYDRSNGDLKLAKFNVASGQFSAPVVLDGAGMIDAGWSPSIAVDAAGVVHVAYVGTTKDDLKYVTDAAGAVPEVIDDGYRIVGQTVDGLPKPEFHFVGEDASLVLANGSLPMVAYQDATTQELLLATKQQDGQWTHDSVAGATQPWPGAYGFFAADAVGPTEIVMSTWVIDQPSGDPFNSNWVEIFARPTVIQ